MILIEDREVFTEFIILPKATGNMTFLETDFSEYSGIVLDVKNRCWYFNDTPRHKFHLGKVEPMLDIPVERDDVEVNVLPCGKNKERFWAMIRRKV
ncbi:hypothetical protein NPIL_419571 [Nephila pilipes]|uniref:Uncharacterized protein n=1 Tax=Nephila pilipes TaxID=299642 RepID=A0A8X6QTI0_NEPPI|nr:hypothetical protein NPIL_419571 [Nephila pilipes]